MSYSPAKSQCPIDRAQAGKAQEGQLLMTIASRDQMVALKKTKPITQRDAAGKLGVTHTTCLLV
jgi:hypothetical protein